MLRNLGEAIVTHPKFEHFNVCVVHGGIKGANYDTYPKTDTQTELKLSTGTELDNISRVFFACVKAENVKKCIQKYENISKKQNKSLIILTSQRLTLGISLPCVDVAIHMNPIHSYDIIYQSMFRVLTDRENKPNGYFVDMNIDRAIWFCYKYTKIQKKLKDTMKLKQSDIRKTLLTFDVGSIKNSINFETTNTPINSYGEIASEFKIASDKRSVEEFEQQKATIDADDDDNDGEEEFEELEEAEELSGLDKEEAEKKETIDTIEQDIKTLINSIISNPRTKNELITLLEENKHNSNFSKKEGKTKSKKNKTKKNDKHKQQLELHNQDINQQDTENVEDVANSVIDDEIINSIITQITNIFTLIILFGGDDITLEEAINTEKLDYYKIKRLCESDDTELTEELDKIMYYCYLIQNHEKQLNPGDIVNKLNNEVANIETGVILKIVKQYICRDESKCLKDGQKIRFTHDKNLIATYKKNGNKLVYNDVEYNSLNQLLKKFYEMVDVYSGWNAWSHFEIEISPDKWTSIMELETKPPDIKILSSASEYARFLYDIDNNENKCKPKSKEPKQSRKKSNVVSDISIIPKNEKNNSIVLAKTKRNKAISQITPIQVLEEQQKIKKNLRATRSQNPEEEEMDMIGGATGTPAEEKTTYYILWNPDKLEPDRCIETYDDVSLQQNVIMQKLTADEIKVLIEKYIGQNGIINFLIEKEKETENKGEKNELNNLFTYIKGEMKGLGQRIEKEKEGFDEETKEDSDICSEFFKTDGNEKVLETIRRYLTPKDSERKLFGEVFTPLELVCEMLSKLPSDVWTKKDYKWLDPANGIGNFPVVVYYKLMKTLTSVPEKDRSRWIIENMLYMNELNKVNVGVCRRIFKMIDPKASPNIIRGDFLKTYNTILPSGEKFNIIIGNPPYNNSFNTGDNKPYLCFTFLSLHILKTDGYLLFISPPAIYDYLFLKKVFTQKCGGETINYDKMLNILTINNDNDYLKGFFKGVGSVFTYYLIQNAPYKGKTNMLHSTNTGKTKNSVKLSADFDIQQEYKVLSDDVWSSITQKITTSNDGINPFKKAIMVDSKRMRRIRKEHIEDGTVKSSKDNDGGYNIEIIEKYSVNNNNFVPVTYWYNDKDVDYDKKRVIISSGPSYLFPHIIGPKQYTLSDSIYYTTCEGKYGCDNLEYLLKSPLGLYIDSKYRPSSDNNKQIELLNKLKALPGDKKFTRDEDVYKFFGLNQKEIERIETSKKNNKSKETKEPKKPKQTKDKKGGAKPGKKRTRKNKGSMWKLW